MVKFHCPHCDGSLEAEGHVSGYETDCPHCGRTIRTPGMGIYPGLVMDDMRIERQIGHGSMGDVYLATQTLLDRKVALKILNSVLTLNEAAVERFMKEVRVLAKLHHPNIVAAYSAGNAAGVHYLAMSYVKGETMAARLQRKGKLPEDDALAVALCVARALNYAWERHQMLHRDIKPGNIMVDQDGEIKLMDMGLSKSLLDEGEGTQAGMLLGTPHYMSPEQADCRKDIDCRADIYGLGATLYHMVTGSPPYPGSTIPEIVQSQLTAPLTPVRERNPAVTKATAALIEKMMLKDREKRQQTWDELIGDISRILVEQFPSSDGTLPATPGDREDRPPRRMLLPLLLSTLVIVAGLDYWLTKNPTNAARAHEFAAGLIARVLSKDTAASVPEQAETPPRGGPLTELIARKLEHQRKNGELPPMLRRLPGPQLQLVVDTMKKLDAKAALLIRDGRLVEAAALYEDYKSDFAPETDKLRHNVARQLMEEAVHSTNAPPHKADAAK